MTRSGAVAPVEVVCWDWNGTLLDDVDRCLRLMNGTLTAFGKAAIPDVERYRELFRFPLQEFYADAGIGPDEYRAAVDHYLAALTADATPVSLHGGARQTIERLRRRGLRHVLASATRKELLDAQVSAHGLAGEFDELLSISDVYGASKREVIADWIERDGPAPDAVLMIGDTDHDREIAHELGTRFVHFRRGHQQVPAGSDVAGIDALGDLVRILSAG